MPVNKTIILSSLFACFSLLISNPCDDAPIDYSCEQSSAQAPYFFSEIVNINNNDIIIAFCGLNSENPVGARRWDASIVNEFGVIDVTVMGKMITGVCDICEFYCEEGETPVFKVYREQSGQLIVLDGIYPAYQAGAFFSQIGNEGNSVIMNTNEEFVVETELEDIGQAEIEERVYRSNQFQISQCYPNPFNPSVNIELFIPKFSTIKLYIADINGRNIEILWNDYINTGIHLFHWNAKSISSGIYFVIFESEYDKSINKILLVK